MNNTNKIACTPEVRAVACHENIRRWRLNNMVCADAVAVLHAAVKSPDDGAVAVYTCLAAAYDDQRAQAMRLGANPLPGEPRIAVISEYGRETIEYQYTTCTGGTRLRVPRGDRAALTRTVDPLDPGTTRDLLIALNLVAFGVATKEQDAAVSLPNAGRGAGDRSRTAFAVLILATSMEEAQQLHACACVLWSSAADTARWDHVLGLRLRLPETGGKILSWIAEVSQ